MDSIEMPKYNCHKQVWALKIKQINPCDDDDGLMLTPAEKGYAEFYVDGDYVAKHNPSVGGYYVVYADKYKSFSPADAFENGYKAV